MPLITILTGAMNVETQYAAAVTTQSIAYHQHSGLANEDINHRSLKQRVDIQYQTSGMTAYE